MRSPQKPNADPRKIWYATTPTVAAVHRIWGVPSRATARTRIGTAATANCHGISSNGVPAHRCARMCTVVDAFAIAATRSIPRPISRSRVAPIERPRLDQQHDAGRAERETGDPQRREALVEEHDGERDRPQARRVDEDRRPTGRNELEGAEHERCHEREPREADAPQDRSIGRLRARHPPRRHAGGDDESGTTHPERGEPERRNEVHPCGHDRPVQPEDRDGGGGEEVDGGPAQHRCLVVGARPEAIGRIRSDPASGIGRSRRSSVSRFRLARHRSRATVG